MGMSEEDLAKLMEKVTLQGNKVRELKAGKAPKAEIDNAVAELLKLKKLLPENVDSSKDGNDQKNENVKKEKQFDERAAKKEARRLARNANVSGEVVTDIIKQNYGDLDLKLLQSKRISHDELARGRKFVEIKHLDEVKEKDFVWIRAFVHQTRGQSKLAFLLLRDGIETVQAVVSEKSAAKFASKITNESVVDVYGKLVRVEVPTKATKCDIEIQAEKVFVVSRAMQQLPLQVIDANRSEAEMLELEKQNETKKEGEALFSRVGLDRRLENRHLDIRTQLMQSIVRISSKVSQSFRNFLIDHDFVEIQTPKLLGGSSEGGAEVFECKYFDLGKATLAQSPQLHKQIMAACSGVNRVFECAPVFRAENSNTSRHLCEFQGLDLEMTIKDHYHEALDLFSDLFDYIFSELTNKMQNEIQTIGLYYPSERLVWRAPNDVPKDKVCGNNSRTLRLEFLDAIQLLRENGVGDDEQGEYADLSTPVEKKLGQLVKDKYGVDFYFLDKFPLDPRPFYTMPCPENPKLSNSYDFFIRGQEIMSGAQRVHCPNLLEDRIKAKGVNPESLRFYIDSFKSGAMPHAGGGVGLERVVMLFLALPNIRLARMFPRDPTRLAP